MAEIGILLISATDEWRSTLPGAIIGLLELFDVESALSSSKLDERKQETEAYLQERYKGFSRQDLLSLSAMPAYEQYYKRFSKTYHVQLQVDSIVLKGRRPPSGQRDRCR